MRKLICFGWVLGHCILTGVPVARSADDSEDRKRPLVFVFTGESNSGGVGRNADATPKEMAPRPSVQIMNLTDGTFAFETMQLGVNNLRGHVRLKDYYEVWHGFENELANAVERNDFPGYRQVYLIKTGQGSARIDEWSEGNALGYWKKFLQRIEAGKRQLSGKPRWVVWFSLGINDGIDKNPIGPWEKKTRAHLEKIKATLPGAVIVMTQFQSMGDDKKKGDAAIARIADDMANVYAVDSSGAGLVDRNHWSYEGLKTMVRRMIKFK